MLSPLFSSSNSKMGRKCCVRNCKSNYEESKAKNADRREKSDSKNETRNKIPTFGFPSKEKFLEERQRWVKSIPYLTEEMLDSYKCPVVCIKHWPTDFEKIKSINGKERPKHPQVFSILIPKV